MLRLVARFLTLALAAVGLASVVGWLRARTPSAAAAPDSLTAIESPGGRYRAVLASWHGGGGLAPYCHDRLFVVSAAAPSDQTPPDEDVVFEAECGEFGLRDGRVVPSPLVVWREPSVLSVTFSVLATVSSPATFRLRRQAMAGQVSVEFEVGR